MDEEFVMALQKPRAVTVDEFETMIDSPEYADRLLELIDGEIVEKMPTEEHGLVVGNIYAPMWQYVVQHKAGRVVMEVPHRQPDDPRNVRLPDIAFIAGSRPLVKKGSVPQMPDLVVEVKSPSDSLKKLREKIRYYLAHGTRLAFLVIPEGQVIEGYRPDEEFHLFIGDILSGADVLPGFSLPVASIFADSAA
jgi:Uma2 family endonuclease